MPNRFEVYTDDRYKEITLFKLEESDETIELNIVDAEGNAKKCGSILTIHKNGMLELHPAISPAFPIELDRNGRIVIEKDF